MSGKRKKTAEEKELSAKRENTTVVCKLSRVCKDPDMLAEIQRTCIVLKQVQLEAWHIANLHVLRCMEIDIELPILDQTFFNWCCQGARANGIRAAKPKADKEIKLDRKRKPARSVDEGLRETVRLYRSERESINGYTNPPQLEYDGNDILQIAGQMRVNAENMIILHFEKRLSMYARLLLEEETEKTVPASEVRRLVRACYREEDGEFAEDETKLRAWLGFVPYENIIKDNLEHFVAKLYVILRKVEASQLKNPNKKGIRSFSLLPYSSSYSAAHVVINGSTLQGFCARIFKETDGRNPLDIPLAKSGKVLQSKEEVCKKKELFLRRGFAVSQFETMAPNVTISRREFDEMDHASKSPFASRLFANQITTNGYSASVLLTRPKLEAENGKKKPRTQRTKNDDVFDGEWLSLPTDYEADALIAIDPGMRSLCTAVSDGGVKNKKKKKAMQAARVPRQVGVETVHAISTREYRHLAGMNKARFWHENLKKRKKHYARAINSIPSYKTSSFEVYVWRLKIFWKHVSFLLKFCADNAFLKWRFFQSRMKEKAADAMAKRLVPIASPRVLVGYGDWSRRDGISGHASSPVKGFRKALKKRATVVPIDEYRTSKLCSNCHSPLEQALLPTKTKDNEVVLKKTRNVLRCPTSSCKANFWNRDVNAARNILSLLKCKLLGLGRLEAFCRG